MTSASVAPATKPTEQHPAAGSRFSAADTPDHTPSTGFFHRSHDHADPGTYIDAGRSLHVPSSYETLCTLLRRGIQQQHYLLSSSCSLVAAGTSRTAAQIPCMHTVCKPITKISLCRHTFNNLMLSLCVCMPPCRSTTKSDVVER
jgi:hypothetical protein